MVALLDLEDIIVVVGRGPEDGEEAARWQYYIEAVSSFINGYVDVSFEEKTDDVVRYQADFYGVVDLGGDPISTVTSVKNWRSQLETTWEWDGLNIIYNLEPNEVVDVTYTHGYSGVPEDIKHMAIQAVTGTLGFGATGPIRSLTVGDITEVYSTQRVDGDAVVISLSKAVLENYCRINDNWRLGAQRFPTPGTNNLPIL